MDSSNSSRRMFFILFTISGFSGLIYESIWSHYLKLFLGHAAYAQTLVLAIFMGGMALGSWWIGARSQRLRNLLIGYAIVEGIVGFLGLVFDPLSKTATSWAFSSVIPALESPWAILLFKWTLAALLILPQSVLLGMTFPLMSGAIVRRFPARSGETLAMLYFTNSFGAAAGVLISGFVLIDKVGLPGTIMTAGLLNVALALVVWGITKYQDARPLTSTPEHAPVMAPAQFDSLQRLILVGALATGAAAFMYEIAWIRMLALVLGSSTHAFELMLSAFILGIALGGLWVRKRIQDLTDPVRYLGMVLMLMAAVALASLQLYNASFGWMASVVGMFTPTDAGYIGFNLGSHAIAIVLMVPTTFFCGLTLPIMTNVLLRAKTGEGAIGAVYAWNTVGAIIGIVLAVHLVMPLLGVKAIVVIGAAIHALLGLAYFAHGKTRWTKPQWAALVVTSVAFFAAIFLLQLDPRRMVSGVYRYGNASYADDSRILYFKHGKTASISLLETGSMISIATNGKPDATIEMKSGESSQDEITMVMAAALPLALHPRPRTVANIGIGSGLTSQVLLTDKSLERVDTIEIEPFMAEAAKLGFMPRVKNTFEDPRSHIHFEDAKTFFATRQERYDVIVSEPSNPWVSGVASLFSDEFYKQLTSYLKEDGMLVQWLQIYETDTGTVNSVLKALGSHFSDFSIYGADDVNILITAVTHGRVPELSDRIFAEGPLRDELARVGIRSLRDIEGRFVGNKALLMPLVMGSGVPANSDYFPYVDQHAIRARVMKRNALDVSDIAIYAVPIFDILLHRTASPQVTQPNKADRFSFNELASQAVAALDSLRDGKAEGLPPSAIRQLAILHSSAAQCRGAGMGGAWVDSAYNVAKITTATLGRSQLEELWTLLSSEPCALALTGDDATWLQLMRAVSLRDTAQILTRGKALLESNYAFGTNEQAAYASVATATAAIATGDLPLARQILTTLQIRQAPSPAVSQWIRDLLFALTSAPTAASSPPAG